LEGREKAIWPRDKKVKGEELQLCKLVKRTIQTAFENCSTATSWLGNRRPSGGGRRGRKESRKGEKGRVDIPSNVGSESTPLVARGRPNGGVK